MGGRKRPQSRTSTRPSVPFPGEEYALVVAMLGDGRATVRCADGQEKMGLIRGGIRRHARITPNTHVLITRRDFDERKVDIVHAIPYEESTRLRIGAEFELEDETSDTLCFEAI